MNSFVKFLIALLIAVVIIGIAAASVKQEEYPQSRPVSNTPPPQTYFYTE